MTKREKQIFNKDIQSRFDELVEFRYGGEEALEGHSDDDLMRIAEDDAQTAYDDVMDSRMEDKREKDW